MLYRTYAMKRRRRRFISVPALMSILALALGACGDGPTVPGACRSKIAFSASAGSTVDLFTMDPDGSNVTRLTTGGADFPSWSRDGQKIAFARKADRIWTINADGTGAVALPIDSLALRFVAQVALAPDGSELALGINSTNGNYVTIAGVDGSLARLTTNFPGATGPSWSPDGRKVAFSGVGGSDHYYEIWSMNADGSNASRLTDIPGRKGQTAWSPDGRSIAFLADSAIYVVGADGSNLRRIRSDSTVSSWSTITWSPDGTRLAYGRWYVSPSVTPSYLSGIAVMNADGSEHRYLVTDTVPIINQVSWSPCLR